MFTESTPNPITSQDWCGRFPGSENEILQGENQWGSRNWLALQQCQQVNSLSWRITQYERPPPPPPPLLRAQRCATELLDYIWHTIHRAVGSYFKLVRPHNRWLLSRAQGAVIVCKAHLSRGVCGHAPPENLHALRLNLEPSEQPFFCNT